MSVPYITLYFIGSFLFLSVSGLIAVWIDRKITARIQFRVGPPWYQNFVDFIKLTGKEVLIPEKANKLIFVSSPVAALMAASLSGVILLLALKKFGFAGDIILLVYLLVIPSLAIILGGSSSGNVLASVGVSRELKLVLSYELPFICAIIIAGIKGGSTTSLTKIMTYQQSTRISVFSISGIIGFFISIFAFQGKLGLVPFDLAEAEGEISTGAFIEYSGILLGLFKLAKAILYIVGPLFIVCLFLGGISFDSAGRVINGILKYFLVLIIMVLIKNTNPRVRIDQAFKFFWIKLTLFGIIGISLALLRW
ncbi:NADH-quinone oxidoreductase subunit H [bacterium]|nr:NADH-quinone oxidoreductase subunit H [bacterium]